MSMPALKIISCHKFTWKLIWCFLIKLLFPTSRKKYIMPYSAYLHGKKTAKPNNRAERQRSWNRREKEWKMETCAPFAGFAKVLLTRAVNTTWTRKHSIIHFSGDGGGGGTGRLPLKWVYVHFCLPRLKPKPKNSKERKYRKSFFLLRCCCCCRLMVFSHSLSSPGSFSWAFPLHHAKLNGFTYSILSVKSPVETQLIVFNCCFSVWKTIAHQLIVCVRVCAHIKVSTNCVESFSSSSH